MKAFVAFCKKEFIESLRTYKFIIMLATFILFGIMSPMIAKILPDLLNKTEMNGMILTIPKPTAMDSWAQFFKNIGQMGVLILVIMFCGTTANEFSKGTLINILTKGMKRYIVILAKFTAAFVIWTVSYLTSFVVTYAYTMYFWEIEMSNGFLTFSGLWLYGLLLVSLMILGGIWFRNIYGSLLLTAGGIIVMSVLNISPQLRKYNPISLTGDTLDLLNGTKVPADFIPALIICIALTVLFIAVSVFIFNRKQV